MSQEAHEPYVYFCQPEPRRNLGPVKTVYDKFLKRKIRVRQASIAMVRNAKDENRKEVTVYLDPYPHVRIDKAKDLQGWYKGANEEDRVRPRPCYTEALLTEPYGGYCPLGCINCYINSGIRGYRATGLVTVPINYGDQIRAQLRKIKRASAGYFTSFHDPFNPLEELYHNSQLAAEEFDKVGLPIFFLSRKVYPDWAVELLMRNKYSYAQKSINTSHPIDWEMLSPGADTLQSHLEDITTLHKAGIYVSIQVNPIIPGITSHSDIKQLFKLLGRVGADHVIVKFIEAGYSWAPTIVERMKHRFKERGEEFAKLFTQNIGGQRTIDQEYRLKAHKLYSAWAKQYGLTYSVCYEYKYETDSDGKVKSKTGVSIGPEVTTSEQCHGKRVPCFTRNSTEEKFKEVKVCPSPGCLYCKGKCNDALMSNAIALRLKDLKNPILWRKTNE